MGDRQPLSVVIGDKNPLVLRGVTQLLDEDPRFGRVVTATDGSRLLDAVDRFRFDLLVVGWVLPHLSGQEVLEALGERADRPRVIVYTGDPDPALPRVAMTLGAAAFCAKSETPERFRETLVRVADGQMVFPFMPMAPAGHGVGLTGRERELLALMAGGATNAELAVELAVSINTVKFHVKNLYQKLGVRNRTEATARFYSEEIASR